MKQKEGKRERIPVRERANNQNLLREDKGPEREEIEQHRKGKEPSQTWLELVLA